MNAVFADTSYYLAILNPSDVAFDAATRWSRDGRSRIMTTEFVLLELANSLARSRSRSICPALIAALRNDPYTLIMPATTELFDRGLAHYAERPDKEWSLTDCASFLAMTELGITEALTTDHHFVQAGFKALLNRAQ
jgi:uncharacterized protein